MIGIDATRIHRIKGVCDRFGDRFLLRFLSPLEISFCQESQRLNYQRIAGFWASKEAISKALGTGIGKQLSFLDIELSKDSQGKPQATLIPSKLKSFGIKSITISITHEDDLAIAVALIAYS